MKCCSNCKHLYRMGGKKVKCCNPNKEDDIQMTVEQSLSKVCEDYDCIKISEEVRYAISE